MDPPNSVFVLDPCRNLSIHEKSQLVHELSKWPESGSEKLQTWSRRDLLEILCAEMGKERKYTGVTKQKLIEHIFRVISDKKLGKLTEDIDASPQLPPSNSNTPSKRQRKTNHPSRLPTETSNYSVDGGCEAPKNVRYCKNLVCKATLSMESAFCKRCTCGVCFKYDENKDPSLWLVCNSDYPYQEDSCGISYHIECILKHERAGIVKNGQCTQLDASFYCVHCQKVNDLLASWRKQLMCAKDARRVDSLCQRVSLSHRFLNSSKKYRCLHEIVDTAMKKLESEVGPLDDFSNMTRGIVNRLSVGAEVQMLCARALAFQDSLFSSGGLYKDTKSPALSNFIQFEDISSTSLTLVVGLEDNTPLPQELLGYSLWHRKSDTKDYSEERIGILYKPGRKFPVKNLSPVTRYIFRVVAFSNTKELANWEATVTTTTQGYSDNSNNVVNLDDRSLSSDTSAEGKEESPMNSASGLDELQRNSDVPKSSGDESNAPAGGNEVVIRAADPLPITPLRLQSSQPNLLIDENGPPPKIQTEPENASKKRKEDGLSSSAMYSELEYCVKMILQLERKKHIEKEFRKKFLTWFCLTASSQERRVVRVYVDTLRDDLESLAGQLKDSFSEAVYSKRLPPVRTGFCPHLWH